MTRMNAALAALLALAACRGETVSPSKTGPRPDQVVGGNIVPRSHAIPPGHASEIRKLFEQHVVSYPISVVSAAGVQTQFVNPPPVFIGADRFVLGTTPEMHDALDQLIATIAKTPAAAQSSTYEISYWVVEATSGEGPVPPDLAEIEPALTALTGLGKRKFKSIDHASTRALDDVSSTLHGRVLEVRQSLSADPDGLQIEVEIKVNLPDGNRSVDTKFRVHPDKVIVLGDSASTAAGDNASTVLLYLVRARRVD